MGDSPSLRQREALPHGGTSKVWDGNGIHPRPLRAEQDCLLGWQTGINRLESVARPDIPIVIGYPTTAFGSSDVAMQSWRIGYNTNRAVVVWYSLRPGQVRTKRAPGLVIRNLVIVGAVEDYHPTQERWRNVYRA